MLPLLINPLPLLLTLATSFGVVLHDTQLDRATSVAIALPAVVASYGAADIALKFSDPHVHTERISISASQPRVQPRSNEDKKYLTAKKFNSDAHGSEYHWPSI